MVKSSIAEELRLRFDPIATILTNDEPEGASQFKEGTWGCVVDLVYGALARGRTGVFQRKTLVCFGGNVGLGFRSNYEGFPGGMDQFQSTGHGEDHAKGIEYFHSEGREEDFRKGIGYKKTPSLSKTTFGTLPVTDIPFTYVVVKPLGAVDSRKEIPQLVTFLANVDQLAALVTLANYDRPGTGAVIIPQASGCQSVFLIPYAEVQREQPQAVVGMLDVMQRPRVDPDVLAFTVPYKMFLQMEANVPESFVTKKAWRNVRVRIPAGPGTDPCSA